MIESGGLGQETGLSDELLSEQRPTRQAKPQQGGAARIFGIALIDVRS
jgi:hypothetical protein